MPLSTEPKNADPTQTKVVDWLETNIGKVVSIARQPRWRPVWFVDVERGSERLELVVRGERVDQPPVFPLRHEMLLQRTMSEHGMPVARVHGWCEEPRAFVMDRVPGVPHFQQVTAAERDAVMREYMEALARLHRLDVEPFAAAGVMRARKPETSSELGMNRIIDIYRRIKKRPDPLMEFCLGWIARHPLRKHDRESVIVWDSGQLHHVDGRFTSFIDVELGHIGDPMMDLAGYRMRDSVIGFGDFRKLYAHYEKHGGVPVDIDAVQYHHLFFTLTNQLACHGALADPPLASDYMTNLQWCNETNRHALEAISERLGLVLPEIEIPAPVVSPVAPQFEHMVQSLRALSVPDEFTAYKLRILFRLARHQLRWEEIGNQIIAADLDDLGELLGRRPASWAEGEAALENFVLADKGRRDEALILLFNRRTQRAQALNGPMGSAMAAHHTLQPF